MSNNYQFFEEESQKYEQILLEFSNNPNAEPFVDENFHPFKKIDEKKIGDDLSDSYKWERIDKIYPAPLFKKELIHPYFIEQGAIGDCYLITSLSRIAKQPYLVQTLFEKKKPDTILGEIQDSINLKCGAVVIYFFAFGRKTPVLIDTRIPVSYGDCIFSHPNINSNSAWFCLVEKAYAKLKGSYSNIVGGQLSYPIYSLFGYYQKSFLFDQKANLTDKILKYQDRGYIMEAGISEFNSSFTINNVPIAEVEKLGLITQHSYLLMRVRKVENDHFYQLRNPHGEGGKVWNGDYSAHSPLLTNELKRALKYRPQKGSFWMIEKDFFKYFTDIEVSKPISKLWTVRLCHRTMLPGVVGTGDAEFLHLEEKPNFAFQIIDPKFNSTKKVKFHVLIEKVQLKDPNFDSSKKVEFQRMIEKVQGTSEKVEKDSTTMITFCHANGKKLSAETLKTGYKSYRTRRPIYTFSCPINSKNDIVTFVLYNILTTEITEKVYIQVFCEYNFKLFDIDDPTTLFPKTQNMGPAFENYTLTSYEAAMLLKKKFFNDQQVPIFCKATAEDAASNDQRSDELFQMIKESREKMDSHHYSNEGGRQIDIDLYKNIIEVVHTDDDSQLYVVTDQKGTQKYMAKVFNDQSDELIKQFSKELSFIRLLKYPSIVNFIGYSEVDFHHQDNPVLLTDFYRRGTLSNVLEIEDQKNGRLKLHEKGFDDWNNTKKMICLIGIALGMKYVHEHKIIHRNLSSSNVYLDENLYPKIGDFGLSKSSQLQYNQTLFAGKNAIIAPELITGNNSYSFPVDVFAYSLIAYHIISHHKPTIPTNSPYFLHLKIVQEEARPALSYMPTKFHNFIKEMWKQDQFERPNFGQIVRTLLTEKDSLWLDDVDEGEVNRYLHQFGLSIGNNKRPSKIEIINSIENPENAKKPQISVQQILSNESISADFRKSEGINSKKAKSFLEIESNRDFLFNFGLKFFLGNKGKCKNVPQDFFYAMKYFKEAALLGSHEALYYMASICLLDSSNQSSKVTGLSILDIAIDEEYIPAFVLYAILYNAGDKLDKNVVMSAVYFKIAADLGDPNSMFEYANFLRQLFQHELEKVEIEKDLEKTKIIINKMENRNDYFYLEARYTMETFSNEDAALYVAKKYFERAAKTKISKAEEALRKIEFTQKEIDYPAQYYDELCQPLK